MTVAVFAAALVPSLSAGAVAGFGDAQTRFCVDPVRRSVDNDTGVAGPFLLDAPLTRGETAGPKAGLQLSSTTSANR